MKYTSIDIIYNPNSTGSSEELAKKLCSKLRKVFPKLKVTAQPTEYAGHAEKLSYELAKSSNSPLIISSSGDGGYNEVINGALKAQDEGANPICAVIPAGNANDHSRTLSKGSLASAIKSGSVQKIDVLSIKITSSSKINQRYGHSYIGFGITPVVAKELNKTDLNRPKELAIAFKSFMKYRPFKIIHNNKVHLLDSIIFANIGEMAKVLTIANDARPNDGLFEVIRFTHKHKLHLLTKFAKAAISGLDVPAHHKKYEFSVVSKMSAQIDGEIIEIQRGSKIRITSEHKKLQTIL